MSRYGAAWPPAPAWAEGRGRHGAIVLSTRARLARNVADEPFPNTASPRDRRRLAGDLAGIVAGLPGLDGGRTVTLSALPQAEIKVLQELRLLAPGAPTDEGRMLVLGGNLARTIHINADDHLRLHAWRAGLEPAGAMAAVRSLDLALEDDLTPAFDRELGYLTACPSLAGTGLTLSALVHLPGLVLDGEIDKVLNALRQLQFEVSGLYGNSRTVRGALFVIENLGTLGRDEEEIADDFLTHLDKIVGYELLARESAFGREEEQLEDLAWRSLAILRHGRLVSAQEMWDLISNVRLGLERGLLDGLSPGLLNRAMVSGGAGHLELAAGRPLGSVERTSFRATQLRGFFGGERAAEGHA